MNEITGGLNRMRMMAKEMRVLARNEMPDEVRKCFFVLAVSLEEEANLLKPTSVLADALAYANFRVGPDVHGVQTVWCQECGRDSGHHYKWCSRANQCSRCEAT